MHIKFTRLLLIAGLIYACNILSAQIPNNGFELWQPDEFGNLNPAGWETTNDDTFISVEPYMPAKSGNFAMRVKALDLGFLTMGGIAFAEFPFNQRPSSFSAWIKTNVMPGDAVYLIISLWKGDTLVASPDSCTFVIDSAINEYMHLSFQLSYQSFLYPDSANIMVVAGRFENPQAGTEIILDELYFGNSVGLEERRNDHPVTAGTAFPNPASETLFIPITVSRSTGVTVEIFNAAGIKTRTDRFESMAPGQHKLEFNVTGLTAGFYNYNLTGEGFQQSGKFIVTR